MRGVAVETQEQMSGPTGIMGDVATTGIRQTLVGRDRELAEMCALLGITSSPTPRPEMHVVLLSGDAGVGKTRLLTELRDRAFAKGWQVVAGHCLDFGDSALPYLPFSEVLGRLAGDHPEVVAGVATAHPGLARLQPGRRMLTDASDERVSVDRAELFDAFHALLGEAGAVQPLLMVIEDAHWADPSTRDLISFLCSRPHPTQVAVVVSYRGEDLHRRHPLRAKAAEWARIQGVARMQLDPLDDSSVRELVRGLHPEPLTESDLAGIVGRAEGNAFFVEELVGASRGGVPVDLADLLLLRLDRLDEIARQVVRTMSVAGRRVSHDLLAAVSGVTPTELDQALRNAVETHVVITAGSHGYAFRHALLAEAVYDDLLPGERVRIHASYVEALRSGVAAGTAAELARHARSALDLSTALVASIQAGDEAASVGGPDEAARHYEHALEIAEDPQHAGDLDVSALVLKTADALVDSGSVIRAQNLLARHLRAVSGTASPTTSAQLHLQVAYTALMTDNDIDWHAHLRSAQALIPAEPCRDRARLLAASARIMALRKLPEARETATEALALAETLKMPRTASDATTTLVGLDREVPIEQLAAALEESAARAVQTGAVAAELRALFLLGRAYQDRGLLTESVDTYARAVERARKRGIPWAPFAFDARLQWAQVAYLLGDWTEVLRLTDVEGQAPPPLLEALLAVWRSAVLSARGESQLDELRRHRRYWERDGMVAIVGAPVEIAELGRQGSAEEAYAVAQSALEMLSANWGPMFQARVRLSAETIAALATNVSDGTSDERSKQAARAEELFAQALTVVQNHQEGFGFWGPESRAWACRIEAEILRMRWLSGIDAPPLDALIDAWQDAAEHFAGLGHPFEVAVSRLRLAEVMRASGDTLRAREEADLARDDAARLGAQPLLGALRQLGTTPVRLVADEESLTPRESEILALVAAGRSNGEIGQQLFISTKTVSVHVSNMLRKLGASGRTEAVAIARRRGIEL